MPINNRFPITVTAPPQSAVTVTVYKSDGSTSAVSFTTETAATTNSYPSTVAISTTTQFWVVPSDYVVSVKIGSVEVAAGYGATWTGRVDGYGVRLAPNAAMLGLGSDSGGAMATLTDVDLTGLADTNTLTYHSSTTKFQPAAVLPVTPGTPTASQVLGYDATSGSYGPISAFAGLQAVNAQTGTTYTLVAADIGKLVTLSNASAVTLTLPQDSDATIAVGAYVYPYQLGAGQVTVAAGSGATLRVSGLTAKARAQYSRMTVQKVSANTWSLMGDLAAS